MNHDIFEDIRVLTAAWYTVGWQCSDLVQRSQAVLVDFDRTFHVGIDFVHRHQNQVTLHQS